MTEREMLERTKRFSLAVMQWVDLLPTTLKGRTLAGQLLRSGRSVGANHRAACRGRLRAEFQAKIGQVEEEADECCFWLELAIRGGLIEPHDASPLLSEAEQLTRIMAASRRTTKAGSPTSSDRKSERH